MAAQKNDFIEIEITGLTAEGAGIGRHEGAAVFVTAAVPGDFLRVRIIKVLKNYLIGKIESILVPSAQRIPIDCPQFPQCGGCAFRQLHYGEELRHKEQRVRDAMQRIGGLSPDCVRPILGASSPDRYRNKAQMPIGANAHGIQMGFYARHSHRIIDCPDCLLQPSLFTQVQAAFRSWCHSSGNTFYQENTGRGTLRHLYLRQGAHAGDLMACVVATQEVQQEKELISALRASTPHLCGILLNYNAAQTNVVLGKKQRLLWGKETITDQLCGLSFRLSPFSFYQVNPAQTQRLYTLAAQYAQITEQDTLLDLYCGIGTIGLTLASRAQKLIGIELVPQAVQDARRNAEINHIQNADFLCMDASEAVRELAQQRTRPTIITLDPPRKGCSAHVIEAVAQMEPRRIVYISCDPSTLARDLKLFAAHGYFTQTVTPVDMFPRTANVECVALLERGYAAFSIK